MTKTLRVDLADLEGIPHASGPSGTSVVVTAEYTSPVILAADGTIILAPKSKTMGASGRVDFDGIYASDSEDVREDHRGFAVRVKVAIREPNGATRTWSRTVKPLEFMTSTVRLGRMPSAEGLPPQWVSVDDVIGAADAAADAASQAATDAEASVTLAQQAQAAAYNVPDVAMRDIINNPATETRGALTSVTGAVIHAAGYSTLHAAVAAVPATGGVVQLEPKDYSISSTLTIPAGVSLRGAVPSSPGSGSPTRILYTGTTGTAINGAGIRWGAENVSILYTSTSYAGTLVDVGRGTDGVAGRAFPTFRNVWFGSLPEYQATYSAAALVDLHGSQNALFENCMFYGGQYLVDGVKPAQANPYAKVVAFRNCTFNRYNQWAVRNPHESWTFDNCVFEPTQDKHGRALKVEVAAGYTPKGVTFNNCWMGDNKETADWIEWQGRGLTIVSGRYLNYGSLVKVLTNDSEVTLIGTHVHAATPGAAAVDARSATGSVISAIGVNVGAAGQVWAGGVRTGSYLVNSTENVRTQARSFQGGNGSTGAPSFSFESAPTSGFYHYTATGRVIGVANGNFQFQYGDGQFYVNSDELRHFGTRVGFYGASAVTRRTLPDAATVTAADVRKALIELGLCQ